MDDYLTKLKSRLNNAVSNSKNVHLVIGNEACDLDSAVSALVFAYFLYCKERSESADQSCFIPILNIPRNEYRLRTEVRYVFSVIFDNGLEDHLIFVDEVPLDALYERGGLSITLVDHHKLEKGHLDKYCKVVCRVIDHHVDNQSASSSYRSQCAEQDGYVTGNDVGSCCTLIAECIFNFKSGELIDENVARLLLGAILIDTSALKDAAKTTSRDIAIVEKLEAVLMQRGEYNRKQLFKTIKKAKGDVGDMTIGEILSKDYKVIRREENTANVTSTTTLSSIGMSTVPLTYEALVIHKPISSPPGQIADNEQPMSLENHFEQFRQRKSVDALVLLCVNPLKNVSKEQKKQVVIYGGDEKDKEQIYQALSTVKGLQVSPADCQVGTAIRVYRQGDPGLGRKQILPILQDFLNGKLGKPDGNVNTVATPSKSGTPSSSLSNPSCSPENPSTEGRPPSSQLASGQPADISKSGGGVSGQNQDETHSASGSRARRFLDSTELARSFSITYDGDEDEEGDASWSGEATSHGQHQLGKIEESRVGSCDGDVEGHRRPLDSSLSCSTTEDEVRHYPTVSTPYATSSYDSGAVGGVVNGSRNTQEESAATLSGVPDLLDSRENLEEADAATGSEDALDLLGEHHGQSAEPSNTQAGNVYNDVDLLRGTGSSGVCLKVDEPRQQLLDSYTPDAEGAVEVSFSSYHHLIGNYPSSGDIQRDRSEPRLFEFSTDPSPATGMSRAETPPSSVSGHADEQNDQLENRRRTGVDEDGELGLKVPGAITPPNTYVEGYLDETVLVVEQAAGGRRPSQLADVEPEFLYMKLKGTQLLAADRSPVAGFSESSVPGTPPNSFVGTPTASFMESAVASKQWMKSGKELELENLQQRVTELTKCLPMEDVELQDGKSGRMDDEPSSSGDVGRRPDSLEFVGLGGEECNDPEIVQYAEEMADDILPKALAEAFYPELVADSGTVNPAFTAGSTATASPSSPLEKQRAGGVFPDFVSAERSLPDVLSENFPSPMAASGISKTREQMIKTPLSTKSSSDLLSTADSIRGLQFDLVSCASAASFGRESTMAHADSTEFTVATKRADGKTGRTLDPRVSTDFSDESADEQGYDVQEERKDETDDPEQSFAAGNTFQTGASGIQWEEEGYPALLDIHYHDTNRIFSDEPAGFSDNSVSAIVPQDKSTVETDEPESSSAITASKKHRKPPADVERHSTPTESGPDSPDTESADEQPALGEGISEAAEKAGGDGLEWENDTPVLTPQKQATEQWAAAADIAEERRWRTVFINGTKHQVDMAAVEPYSRVISHGGYYGEGLNAIAVFAACYLPSRNETDYNYLMDNLFLYAVSMLDTLVAEDYVIIYFQGGSTGDQMPPFSWLRKCYRLIDRRHVSHTEIGLDRRLRKNLKGIYLVHPTLWLRTVVTMAKPFISSKFSKKVHFIQTLNELGKLMCMDQVEIPDEVLKHDHERMFARSYTNTYSSRPSNAGQGDAVSRRTSAHTDTTRSDGVVVLSQLQD